MSRLRSSLRFAATAALCVAVALGVISHLRGALVGWVFRSHTFFVRSEYGKLAVHAHRTDPCYPQGSMAATWPLPEPALAPGIGGWWTSGGFAYARGGTSLGFTIHQLVIPYWSIALAALVVRLLCHAPRHRASRDKNGKT